MLKLHFCMERMSAHTVSCNPDRWTFVDHCGELEGPKELFARLSDAEHVPGIEPIDLSRGLSRGPNQPSFGTWEHRHKHPGDKVTSWLTLAELEAEDWSAFIERWPEAADWATVMADLQAIAGGDSHDRVRIIFWFYP